METCSNSSELCSVLLALPALVSQEFGTLYSGSPGRPTRCQHPWEQPPGVLLLCGFLGPGCEPLPVPGAGS